jgi:formylglycine-generating enzyme required for sulfatase activity
VYELCRDTYADYGKPPATGDGLRGSGPGDRVARGGACDQAPLHARSAMRRLVDAEAIYNNTGLRPARAIRP